MRFHTNNVSAAVPDAQSATIHTIDPLAETKQFLTSAGMEKLNCSKKKKVGGIKFSHESVIFQIIAFDELRTDFKNPIDQSNPTRAVRTLLFLCFQEGSDARVQTEESLRLTFNMNILFSTKTQRAK